MGGNLRDFLVGLASSPELMAEFAADPAGTLDRAGLSAADQAAVLARDSDRLRRALGASAADHLTHVSSTVFKKLGIGRKPWAKKRGVKKPGAKKPGARKPGARKPGARKSGAKKSGARKRPASKRRAGTKKR